MYTQLTKDHAHAESMTKFMDILPTGQRMTKAPHAVIPILLRLLETDRDGRGFPADDQQAPGEGGHSSPVATAALACLARVASCSDGERRNALRDALTSDDLAWEATVPALLSELTARMPRMRSAANAALVLWVAIDDDLSKKERLVTKQKVTDPIALGMTMHAIDVK